MSALTVKSVTKALSGYVRPDEDIVAKLNLVMPRLYAMGMWRDLIFDWEIETTNGYFSLPEDAEGLLGVLMEDSPVDVQARWHDYRISGYASEGTAPIFGVVDDGWHAVKEDLPRPDDDVYQLKLTGRSPFSLPEGGQVTVDYTLSDGTKGSETFTLNGESELLGSAETIAAVNQIAFDDVHSYVTVTAVNKTTEEADDDVELATLRGDGVTRYRRFRFENISGSVKNVKLLLKRAWQPVLVQKDTLHLANLNAIKHALIGMEAEDNADIERAQYHWTICRQILDEELDAARGAAKPKLMLNPSGIGSRIPNMM